MTTQLNNAVLLLAVVAALLGVGMACGGGDDEVPNGSPAPPSALTGTAPPSAGPGGGQDLEAFVTSTDLSVGSQRFAFVLFEDGVPVSEDDVTVRFFKLKDESNPQLVGEGTIPWSPLGIPGLTASTAELTGVYYANIEFDEAGKWGAGFTIGGPADPAKEVRVSFEVRPEPLTVGVGEPAIPVDNPTISDTGITQVCSAPEPNPAFHQLSIDEALRQGKPTVIAFTTPAFCTSRTCGPDMELVNAAYEEFGDEVSWVHVEPFKLDLSGSLITEGGERVNSDAGNLWQLPSEPWIFVVDTSGTVVARLDGPVTLEELEHFLNQVTGG